MTRAGGYPKKKKKKKKEKKKKEMSYINLTEDWNRESFIQQMTWN